MSFGIRGRLFSLAALMIVMVVGAAGFYVQGALVNSLRARLELELQRHAKTVGVLVEHATNPSDLDAIADRAAAATHARVDVFDLKGRPIASSQMAPLELEQLSNPSEDPEVHDAIRAGRGQAVRDDGEGGVSIMHVALKVAAPGSAVVARASAPLVSVQTAVGRLWMVAIGAGVAGMALAAALLIAVGSHFERALQPVVSSAAAVAKAADTRDGELSPDDVGPQSFQTVAVDLERAMRMLSSERNRFEAVLQTMEQAVLVLDADDHIVTVNDAAYTLLSLPARAIGRTLLEAVRVPRLKALAEAVSDGRTHEDEFDLPSGLRIDVRATPHADEGVVIVAQDVTEIRHLERVRRDFVANVSHELRTPISVIRANAETLLDGALEDQKAARMFVEATHRHADRLGRIVTDLLDISRIEAGRYLLHPSPLNVGDTVDHVLDLIESNARDKGIELSVDIDPQLEIQADRKAMEHILINLASNAFKYTPKDGKVEFTAHALDDDMVRIEVLDNGPGIDPAHRERIFERFFRVDAGRSRDMGGTGLGLSIVKNLVEAQGGDVGVDPRSPRGSVFWFTLPTGPLDLDDDQEATSS